jgi:rhamnosyltransferase
MNHSIAGVTILYNPEKSVINNIFSYLSEIDLLFLVDNSNDGKERDFLTELIGNDKIVYYSEQLNMGVARALNFAAKSAKEKGYKWLLTMDQDSIVNNHSIKYSIMYIKENFKNDIGIVSPFHYNKGRILPQNNASVIEEKLTTMTSGNFLNLEAYSINGSFLDKLFIDYVDMEYCLRLRNNGYKIIQFNNYILDHNLGDIQEKKLFGKTILVTNHNHIRKYYITRNRLYVLLKYRRYFKSYFLWEVLNILKDTLKLLLFEKNKVNKIKYIFKGALDFITNKYGALRS